MSHENQHSRPTRMPDLNERQAKLAMLGMSRALELALRRVYELTSPERGDEIAELRADILQDIRNAAPRGVTMSEETAVIDAVTNLVEMAFPPIAQADGQPDGLD